MDEQPAPPSWEVLMTQARLVNAARRDVAGLRAALDQAEARLDEQDMFLLAVGGLTVLTALMVVAVVMGRAPADQ
jgi:hypothetical protein